MTRVSTASFRADQFNRSLTPARRRDIARRPRFYSLPWLRQADEPDEDPLP